MLKDFFLPKTWMGSNEDLNSSKCILVGIPYDGTCSYRPGTRFGPERIRSASWGLEEYSPILGKSLEDVSFYDAGELDLPLGNRDKVLEMISEVTKNILESGKIFFGIGGEHLVTYPVVKEYLKKYPDMVIVHFDAHADLREEYLDEKFSHATVMQRIMDHTTPQNLIQIGIRSGTKQEILWMKENNTLLKNVDELRKRLSELKDRPIFITLDLDVLDPSIMSGTGTPEPGGMTFNELIEYLLCFKNKNIVGCDVVELSPDYDPTGVSTAVATKIIRELLLIVN